MGRFVRTVSAVLTAIIFALWPWGSVLATTPDPPDVWGIVSAQVFRHVVEHDDFIVVFQYQLDYTVSPNASANNLFLFRLLDDDGITELGTVIPYPFYNGGYSQGLSAIYFSESTAPDWLGAYQLQIMGNPAVFPDLVGTPAILAAGDYYDSDNYSSQRAAMGNYVLTIMQNLQTQWGMQLVVSASSGLVLGTYGDSYARAAIPGLAIMCPSIFSIQESTPTPDDRTYTDNINAGLTRWTGTFVQDALDGLQSFSGLPITLAMGAGILLVWVLLFRFSQNNLESTAPALLVGGLLFVGGSVLGFINWALIGISALLFIIYLVYILVLRNA